MLIRSLSMLPVSIGRRYSHPCLRSFGVRLDWLDNMAFVYGTSLLIVQAETKAV